ncbi:hypothetical protein [Mucilaginibacter ginsenosidivorans]|uniref:Uncharacterized protein n=1 Tax=Mucilaginibacter ginsenosidivorans TaxID=398053 RepID=A0A5B8UZX2_9SPHI|nr:hypothetical protein [Mucilaginibacter ginsenosidivorans]QEC64123.1 hypothetical protein FRZ54_16580 [Mucilaginibacter ginsenosidivorans]
MLRIEVSPGSLSELDFTKLVQFDIPKPAAGVAQEINNNAILIFEDEQEAIDYAHLVDGYAESLEDHNSTEYLAANDIIKAIGDDEFVQAYIQS